MADDVLGDPTNSREEILAATYQALREHGYADLTIQRISDEFNKSTSLLYYHYDDKDELVLATLEFLLGTFEEQFTDDEIVEPRDRMETLFGQFFDANEERAHLETLIQLRARATHDDAYRRHFRRSDQVLEAHFAEILRAGIESGEFRECDPDAVATALVVLLNGVLLRRSTDDAGDWLEQARHELDVYLETRVYADGSA